MLFDRVIFFFFEKVLLYMEKTKGRDMGVSVWVVLWGLGGGGCFVFLNQ